jgi:thioredoxin reductase (NADPH)
MSTPRSVRVAILGSGPAGLTAAIYSARALLEPVVISGMEPGGQLTITTDVENYPGFAEVIQGPWLMDQMRAQAEHVGTEFLNDVVTSVDLSRRPFRLELDSGAVILAETLIIATGAQARWLGLESEQTYRGFGVSACATCDGFFYRGKPVAVVGGGNTAVEEALYLANIASHVTLVHRRDKLRSEKILQDRLFKLADAGKVSLVWNHAIHEILGDEAGVTHARLRPTAGPAAAAASASASGAATRDIRVDGVFIAVGHQPNTQLFEKQLEMRGGYIVVKGGSAGDATATSVPGVFAAGDVADHVYRQAVTSAGTGCMAALDADRFLEGIETEQHAEPVAARA